MVTKVILNQEQTQLVSDTNQQQAQAIVNAAQSGAISGNQFVFFAAFDGTNNTLDNSPKANEQTTNVAQLWDQYEKGTNGNSQFGGKYYAGPGTPGTLTGSSWLPPQVTQQVINKAQEAYTDFAAQASKWLKANPGTSVTVALTSFSRGDASAAIFSQMLYEKGLVDPASGEVLIAPGQVKVSAGVIFDPVTTGAGGNLAFAPNVSNLVNIRARNEYRHLFKASDYSSQPGMTTIEMLGNHCDIGGGYDNGIGALSLQAATGFFQRAGLTMGDVPTGRQFDPAQVFIHDESVDDFGNPQWDVYSSVAGFPTAERLFGDQAFAPAGTETLNGTTAEVLTLYNGDTVRITRLDGDSERVELDALLPDGTFKRTIHDYHGIADAVTPEITGDEILIRRSGDTGIQTVDATFFAGNETVSIDIAGADGDSVSTLSVHGIGQFTMTAAPDGTQDEVDASGMETGVRIDLSAAGTSGGESNPTAFSIGIAASAGIENAKSGSGDDKLAGNDAGNVLDGGAGDDVLEGGAGADGLFGGEGDDVLKGGSGADGLLGGAGGDTLDGRDGEGGDILEGGDGYDVYYADGGDTIRDTDGSGQVNLNGKTLGFAVRKKGETVYHDNAGNTFVLAGGRLAVNDPLIIEGFENGQLGIYLDEEDEDPEDKPDYDPDKSKRWIDPLALDLNGNGKIDTVASTQSKAYFDFNGDGVAERAGWIAPGDGLLVLDANANGAVDNLSELFGTDVLSGFADLKQRMDGNNDNVVDDKDANFAQLRVWLDANGDGVAQNGELKTLELLGISSIDTDATMANIQDAGNVISATGSFQQNGQDVLAGDVEFAVDFALTNADPNRPLDQNPVLAADVLQLPWLRGYGLVKSLHLAYESDPQLKQAARDLIGQGRQAILSNFSGFFAKWTGLEAAHQAKGVTRANLAIEDKVWILETLMGQDTNKSAIEAAAFGPVFTTISGRRLGWDENYINFKYAMLESRAALGFAIQATAKDWLKGAYYSLALDKFVVTDASLLQAGLQTGLNAISNADDARFAALVLARMKADEADLDTASMKQALAGSPYAHIFSAALDFEGEHVILMATPGVFVASDNKGWFTVGSAGHDRLTGGAGTDVLDGGAGNDYLQGGAGNDVYFYKRGDGSDFIDDYVATTGNVDTVLFDSSVSPHDVFVNRGSNSLYLNIRGTSDRLELRNWFESDQYKVERIEFADGTVWDTQALLAASSNPSEYDDYLVGTGNDDALDGGLGSDTQHGGAGNDSLEGGAGSDYLQGGTGNDSLEGGTGSDYLQGGTGNDVYLFKRGDGADSVDNYDTTAGNVDTVRFADGIAASDIKVTRDPSHLYLSIKGTSDRLTLQYWFLSDQHKVERVEFADGTVWGIQELIAASVVATEEADDIYGTSGNDAISGQGGADKLYGERGGDTLDGGAGNDFLQGDAGNDVYLFKRGDGADSIYEQDATAGNVDTVRFADGIAASDVKVTRDPSHLYLSIKGTSDRLTLLYWFTSDQYKVERVEFADGTVWGIQELSAASLAGTEEADDIYGTSGNDAIAGLGGNDQLHGQGGNDALDGGAGNDTLHSGADNDTLEGGTGNDYLQGGTGNDVYLFKRGNGDDTIFDHDTTAGNADTVRFADGIAASDIKVMIDSSHLYLNIKGTSDWLTLQHWFTSDQYKVERVEFADGTVWGIQELIAAALAGTEEADELHGTSGNDAIAGLGGADALSGQGGNDALNGGAEDDTLFGNTGNDTLEGGTGSDYLQGDAGNDVYLFKRGDGADMIFDHDTTAGNVDTVRFADGIAASDIKVTRDSSHLYLSIKGTSDRMTLLYWFTSDQYKVERVEFADGTVWGIQELIAAALTGTEEADSLVGTGGNDAIAGLGEDDQLLGHGGNDTLDGGTGNDTLRSGAGNDTLEGGAGSDYLQGESGNDVYLFKRGDGADTISDHDATAGNVDTIRFAAGIAASDVKVTRYYSELYLNIEGTSDRLALPSWFAFDQYKVERVEFADGTVWGVQELIAASLAGTEGADHLQGTNDNNVIAGLGGDDRLDGQGGDDALDGGAGNDTLDGGVGNDTLEGGTGNDHLLGETGNDVYLFKRGDGADTVFDYDETAGNIDTVRFADGIAASDIKVTRDSSHLYLSIKGTWDRLTLQYWFLSDQYKVERVKFADGTVWGVQELIAATLAGTEEADDLYGTSGNDAIAGLEGADELYGQHGDDILDGGAGNDVLQGDAGNDVYLFKHGDGSDTIHEHDATAGNIDTIRFDASVAVSDIEVSRDISHLALVNTGTAERITLENWFDGDDYKIERVEFTDGTVWNAADLTGKARTVIGTEGHDRLQSIGAANLLQGLGGDDYLSGLDGTDTLDGGGGDDSLEGKAGNDVYLFRRGDGSDTIYDDDATANNVDTIRFDTTVSAADVRVTRDPSDLYLTINGTTDRIVLRNWFLGDAFKLERVEFADGTTWSADDLIARLSGATDGDDSLTGTDTGEVLLGLDGNDSLHGQGGDDTLEGGAGNDYLHDGSGNDVYLFKRGDGADTIEDHGSTAGNVDTIRFDASISAADIKVTSSTSGSLYLSIAGTTDRLALRNNWQRGDSYKIERIEFADGTVWNADDLISRVSGVTDFGTEQSDSLFGENSDDVLQGGGGPDSLRGQGGSDTLDGGTDDDYLRGGTGNDVYLFKRGDGSDTIDEDMDTTAGNIDTIRFDASVSAADVKVSRDFSPHLYLDIAGTMDRITLQSWFSGDGYKIERVEFADGTVWNTNDLFAKALQGGAGRDTLIGGIGNDVLDGGDDNDFLNADSGHDTLHGGTGNDTLVAGDGDDVLDGGADDDYLLGDNGVDVLDGGTGRDGLAGGNGSDLLNGGVDNDMLDSGADNDFLMGGAGNDLIATGTGYDVIAFNRGDGQDAVMASAGKDNTLSLGSGIAYADLSFMKTGNDLVLVTGANEQVTFRDWYASADNHSVSTLQMVIEGTSDYNAASTDAINNKKIAQFDFDGLVAAFDQARTATPALTSWALSSSLLDFHLGGSDTAAIGGDLAYHYARNGNLSAISITPAQALLASTQFGTVNQSLQPASALQDTSPRLS